MPNPIATRRGKREGRTERMRCRIVDDIAREALRIIDEESSVHPESRAEFFFRGESKNHQSDYDDEPLLAFGCGDNKKSPEPTFSPSDYDNPFAPSYGIKQVGYIRIAAEAKKDIRKQLRYFGMEAESVYSELSNVCEEFDNRFMEPSERIEVGHVSFI